MTNAIGKLPYHRADDAAFWDRRYESPDFLFGVAPNQWLTLQAGRLPATSRIFVPGDGEGRNGVWLAEQGHVVDTIDISPVGVRKALELAGRRGVTITAREGDLTHFAPPAGAYDAIVSIFLHFEPAARLQVHAGFARAMRPGGLLIVEAFAPAQLGRRSGGPPSLEMLYTCDGLRSDFGHTLEALVLDEAEVKLDEGLRHRGYAAVVRGIFRKNGEAS